MENLTYKKAGVMLAYPMAYLFFRSFMNNIYNEVAQTVLFTLITIAYCGFMEIVLRGRGKTTTKEGYFWYGAATLASATALIAPEAVISYFGWFLCMLFAAVTSGGASLDGHGYSFITRDLMRSLSMTFNNTSSFGKDMDDVKKLEAQVGKKKVNMGGIVKVAALMAVIFIAAFFTLCTLDDTFGNIGIEFLNLFGINLFGRIVNMFISAIFAIPFTFLSYSLISGFASKKQTEVALETSEAENKLSKKRSVSHIVFDVFAGLFIVMYGAFFGTHSATILQVFKGTSPNGMLLSEYARSGFFSLVFIMVLNSLVFLVLLNYGKREDGKREDGRYHKSTKILMTVLFVETIIFAGLSFGRLAIYFDTYGYTPKRMLAMWGTLVMTVASGAIIKYINKKETDTRSYMRIWVRVTTVSYILMCIATAVCAYIF